MRTIGEIVHPDVKISLFSWNGKFLVKFEQGPCEQLFKFEHLEISEADVRALIKDQDTPLVRGVLARFKDMQQERLSVL